MKIALLMTHLANGGGAYQLIFLARELIKLGHEVTVVTYYQPEPDFTKEWLSGLTLVNTGKPLPSLRHDSPLIGLIRYIGSLTQVVIGMWQLVRQLNPDVIQPHEWPAHWPAVLYRLKHPKVKVVWMCNDVWHIPGYEEYPERRIGFWLLSRFLLTPFDRWMTRRVSVITVLDNRIKKIAGQYYLGTPIQVVRSGIDLARYPSTAPKLHREWMWLCFSIFHHHRRFEDVIRAFARILETTKLPMKLVIVGSDVHAPEYSKQLKTLVSELRLGSQVGFVTRYLSHEEKLTFMNSCDGFIFPNETQTWGLAVIEAMALGKPCIVSTGAGVHEIIEDGVTGLLYPVGNIVALAEAMQRLMNSKNSIGEMGQKMVRERYSWTAYAKSMEAFL